MMRIIHLSDFHYSSSSRYEYEKILVDSLCRDIEKFKKDIPIDILIISGDLINKGGEGHNDPNHAFREFEKVIIDPIINCAELNKNRIFMVPGNHDIVRGEDSEISEYGLRDTLNSIEFVNKYILDGNTEGRQRVKYYNNYQEYFYKGTNIHTNTDGYYRAFKFDINGFEIGIACLDSAWRAYDSNTDKGKLLLGECQVQNAYDYIKNCNLKVAVAHHPLDWMAHFEIDAIDGMITKYFDIYLCGHVHKSSTKYITKVNGSLLFSIAPGVLDLRSKHLDYCVGYRIIDYVTEDNCIICHSRRFSLSKRDFVPNNDEGDDNGIMRYDILGGNKLDVFNKMKTIVKKIKDIHLDTINGHLLTYGTDTNAPQNINEIFVKPRLILEEKKDSHDIEEEIGEVNADYKQLYEGDDSFIIIGKKEAGKTILIDKIFIDICDSFYKFNKIPIYIDFFDLRNNEKIITSIRRFIGEPLEIVENILNNMKVVLLVDNISFESKHRKKINNINKFSADYPNVQIIATNEQDNIDIIPVDIFYDINLNKFKVLKLKDFKSTQIKQLIKNWFGDGHEEDMPFKMDKLVSAFKSLNLPCTPFAISMFLWIIEKQENYRPMNISTMLENFIFRLFKKLDENEMYSEKFDYKNKEILISDIAHYMFTKDAENYKVKYIELLQHLDNYSKRKKLEFNSDELLRSFVVKGIFVKEGDCVRFRFRCFFEFFLMKRMDYDNDFREYVLEEDNYLKFINEIDYFTGIKRNQADILKLIIGRMNSLYEELNSLILTDELTYDSYFKVDETIVEKVDESIIMDRIRTKRPSEKELEIINDQDLDNRSLETGIQKKERVNKLKMLSRSLMLASKVLKNTEEIDSDNLKYLSYNDIIKCSISFMILYKLMLQYIFENDDQLIPKEVKSHIEFIYKFIPLLHQLLLFNNMGSAKLSVVIREKITEDKKNLSISDIEKYLSVFLYSDIRGKDYDAFIKEFVKSIKEKYIYDMVFFKLILYYYLRSKNRETDKYYENIIADIVIKSKKLKKKDKGKIIQKYKKEKQEKKRKDDEQLSFDL